MCYIHFNNNKYIAQNTEQNKTKNKTPGPMDLKVTLKSIFISQQIQYLALCCVLDYCTF